MKKTFRFLSMAALLVVGAIMTGCSSDDNIDNPQQPANNDNVVTLTATVSLDGAAGTRAITPGGTAADPWTKTFESTNKIAVIYKNGDGTQKAESGALTLSADGTKATFTVSLTSPTSNSAIRYIYPATMAKDVATDATITDDAATIDYSGLLSSQDGTLETLGTNYDLAVFDGSLSGTDLPALATLTNPLAICKFTLKKYGGSDAITSSVTSLTVSDGTNAYAVTPSGLDAIYVAMKPASGNIAFTARTTDSKTYFRTATSKSLVAGTIYTSITVSMQELTLGDVIGKDGNIYANAAAASTQAAAVIVYLGSDNCEAAPYNHGLALALSDASTGCKWSTSQTNAGHTKQNNTNNLASESGLQYNVMHNSEIDQYPAFKAAIANNSTAAPTGCSSWFLASAYQWQKMAGAVGGLNNLGLQDAYYWSSTEVTSSYALRFNSGNGNWSSSKKTNDNQVRACLAF